MECKCIPVWGNGIRHWHRCLIQGDRDVQWNVWNGACTWRSAWKSKSEVLNYTSFPFDLVSLMRLNNGLCYIRSVDSILLLLFCFSYLLSARAVQLLNWATCLAEKEFIGLPELLSDGWLMWLSPCSKRETCFLEIRDSLLCFHGKQQAYPASVQYAFWRKESSKPILCLR